MAQYVIHGGNPLNGEVEISGAKNAAVAIRNKILKNTGPKAYFRAGGIIFGSYDT